MTRACSLSRGIVRGPDHGSKVPMTGGAWPALKADCRNMIRCARLIYP